MRTAVTLKVLVGAGTLLPVIVAACVLLATPSSPGAQGAQTPQDRAPGTLKAVKERGEVRCGVSEGLPGLSAKDDTGQWSGFDVDFCRALAAAIFDDPSKVTFTPLSAEKRFVALASGSIDVLARNTTWTLTREAGLGMQFAAITYYDGQGFIVRKSRGASSASELGGAKVCVEGNTTTELNLEDYFRAHNVKYEERAFPTADETMQAYDDGRCDVLSGDLAQLHSTRLRLKAPDDHIVLPDVISKEPLGPAVHAGDDQWLNLVKWTHFAMVNAEELGVTQKNLSEAMESDRAEMKRLLGSYAALGEVLGLSNDWAARIIRHVGNYGEVFERNLGTGSKLAIPRGSNRLWINGGLQYAPPMR
ncbi:amino acid ABC transporter substrate-binding protein [Bradyrhizobium sp. ARR65]|uniref:amino acid ABC transporter substrate-binding protein n=1 Tax=Bradyrhizobium sp. ARR65 TaxID=1040989 RepID=UPI0006879539|nr:amino acid ABC transporter substrate-binding protein [Bradyrhizobium sp. ARR65]